MLAGPTFCSQALPPTKALLGEEMRWDSVPMSGSQFVALGAGWLRSSPDPACADMADVLEIYSGRRFLSTLADILSLKTRACLAIGKRAGSSAGRKAEKDL